MKTKRRIYIEEMPLAAAMEINLSETHAHYLTAVLRLTQGAEIHVFNARYGEWVAEIKSARKAEVIIHIKNQTRAPLPSLARQLTLAFAPLKKDRTDFLVEKASELGANFLQPVFTDHTQSDRVNIERLAATAIEAAEQCDRLDVPQVLEPVKLPNYLDQLPPHALLFLAAESGAALAVATAFERIKTNIQNHPNIHFLIGPEGGFSETEFERFDRCANIHRLRLGPRLLRAETAAIAVLSAFQMVLGDWTPE